MKHYYGICLVVLTLAAVAFFALRSCTAAVDQTIDHVRSAFSEALHLQPKITINQRVVLTQTAPIAELAVVTKEELITTGLNAHLEVLSYPVPLTEKALTAEAVYRVKAGFDLREAFTVQINPVTHAVSAAMPHAKILSVEQIGQLTYKGTDATFNRITDEERTQLIANLNAAAHEAAEKSGLKEDAEKQVTQRLDELLKRNGQSINIDWNEISAQPLKP